jgi:hypothetical protein
MTRSRKAVALGCVALIVLTCVFPLGGVSIAWLEFTPTFVLVPPPPEPVQVRESANPAEQPVALFSILGSRGPPSSSLA